MNDKELILHILNNLPKEYATTIELFKEELTSGLSLDKLKERVQSKFRRIQKDLNQEEVLVALMIKKQFKSACQACGKIRHRREDCFTLKKE